MERLETQRLILRSWTMDDLEDLYEYAKTDLVGPNAGWPPHQSIDDSQLIIENFIKEDEVYAIELKDSGKVIGSIGMHKRQPDEDLADLKQVEIGYVLNPQYWGQGFMPEAVEAVKKYSFEVLALDLIWCGHYDYNENSKRVIQKTGFNYHFSKKKTLDLLDGKEVEILIYNIWNPMR